MFFRHIKCAELAQKNKQTSEKYKVCFNIFTASAEYLIPRDEKSVCSSKFFKNIITNFDTKIAKFRQVKVAVLKLNSEKFKIASKFCLLKLDWLN